MADQSLHFVSFPESAPGNLLRHHLNSLDRVSLGDVITDGVHEVWIDFEYSGHSFTVNNQCGEYWFFVRDHSCPKEILDCVADHAASLLKAAPFGIGLPTSKASVLQSLQRICLATLIAVPATTVVTLLLLLCPPVVGFCVGLAGLVLFQVARTFDRVLLTGIGGILMFAGMFAWALQQ